MWHRVHIQCDTCEKVTNLRVHIPEKKEVPINFKCLNCSSELKASVHVDFSVPTWEIKVHKGIPVNGEFNEGDYFYEFSDSVATRPPSDKPFDGIMPTLRKSMESFIKQKEIKDSRRIHTNEEWEDVKTLARAYARFDKAIIDRLAQKLIGDIHPKEFFNYKIDLDYHRAYFLSLNFFVFPWIDSDSHSDFVTWVSGNIFNESSLSNAELTSIVNEYAGEPNYSKVQNEIAELIVRFIELREYFEYAYIDGQNAVDNFAANHDFSRLKNFYTDCFELLGRESHLVFRFQNMKERGGQDNVPTGSPRNVNSADDFKGMNHGNRLDIIELSSDDEPKLIFSNSFDSKLRNGINHYKAKLDPDSQVIKYYPITRDPEREFTIDYIDFLNKALDCFNSVLKIGQIYKMMKINEFARSSNGKQP